MRLIWRKTPYILLNKKKNLAYWPGCAPEDGGNRRSDGYVSDVAVDWPATDCCSRVAILREYAAAELIVRHR